MSMVCPQCKTSFEQRLHCPQCGTRLLYNASRRRGSGGDDEPWQQTPWGRLVIGLLLAQGLYYVLRQFCTAGILVAHEDSASNVWATLTGLILLQSLQAVGVLAAGLLIGAGQRRGFLFGAVVGVWNGVFFLVAQYWTGRTLTPLNLVAEPIIQVAIGGIGGLFGSLIWRPMPTPALGLGTPNPLPLVRQHRTASTFAGPLAWARVLTGTALAVGGVLWVDVIRQFVLDASEGKLRVDSQLQAELVTWEISALALLAGGALAGATTKNGSKQGLAVGIAAAALLVGIRLGGANAQAQLLVLTVISAVCLCLVGGWFGGGLLPPVYKVVRRKGMHAAPP